MKRFYYITLLLVLLFATDSKAFTFDPSEVKNAYDFSGVNAGFVSARSNGARQAVRTAKQTTPQSYSAASIFTSSSAKKRSSVTTINGLYRPVYQTGSIMSHTKNTITDFHNLSSLRVDAFVPVFEKENVSYGLDIDDEDEPIGYKTPIGDVVLPLLILLAVYGAFVVRRYNKKRERHTYRRR